MAASRANPQLPRRVYSEVKANGLVPIETAAANEHATAAAPHDPHDFLAAPNAAVEAAARSRWVLESDYGSPITVAADDREHGARGKSVLLGYWAARSRRESRDAEGTMKTLPRDGLLIGR